VLAERDQAGELDQQVGLAVAVGSNSTAIAPRWPVTADRVRQEFPVGWGMSRA